MKNWFCRECGWVPPVIEGKPMPTSFVRHTCKPAYHDDRIPCSAAGPWRVDFSKAPKKRQLLFRTSAKAFILGMRLKDGSFFDNHLDPIDSKILVAWSEVREGV